MIALKLIQKITSCFVVICLFTLLADAAPKALGSPALLQSGSEPTKQQPAATEPASDDIDDQQRSIMQMAQKAQTDKDYKFAAEQWQLIWEKYPNSTYAPLARLQAGICKIQTQDYQQAIDNLRTAIPKLTDQEVQVPKAKLFLGFSQYELGKRLQVSGDEAQQKQSIELLVTATQTFERLLASSPKFADAVQACYFQGGAFEALDKKEKAIESYKRMASFQNEKQVFKYDALFAIADLYYQLGQYDDAKKYFQQFRDETKTSGHPDLDVVNLSAAKTAIALGIAAGRNASDDAAKANFSDAVGLLKEITQQSAAGKNADFASLVVDANNQMAFCYRQLKDYKSAAELYATVAKSSNGDAATTALAYSGVSYRDAGDDKSAEAKLAEATKTASPAAAEAAHWLAGIQLKQKRHSDAYELASKFIPVAKPAYLVPLKLDQAEAAIEIEGKQAEAISLLQAITTDHADHELAPAASYNLAYSQVQADDFAAAVKTADQFLQRYPESDYRPDVLEVKADALLIDDKPAEAAKIYQSLLADAKLQADPKTASKRNQWAMAAASCEFQQKNFQAVVTQLQPIVQTLAGDEKARAMHLIGTSEYQLKRYPEATSALTQAVNANPDAKQAAESRLFLCLSQLEQKQFDAAKITAFELASKHPGSPLLNQANYRLGTDRYEAEQYSQAIELFQKVIDSPSAHEQEKSNAIYSAGWSHLKAKQLPQAEQLFTRVLTEYPQSDLVNLAKTGRATTRRLAGDNSSSVEDLKSLVETASDDQKSNLMLEMGLAQVDQKKWPEAIKTFESLVKASPADSRLDRIHYELAWANRAAKNEPAAMAYFEKIAKETPDSSYAAEANFHLGKAAYESERWDDSISAFKVCSESKTAEASLREKAAYKLAWANYKQNKFSEAHTAFKSQVEQFPQGELLADGQFMVAESLFRNSKFAEALTAYKTAKPVVDASAVVDEKLKWLVMLHGAQSANKAKDFSAAIDLAAGIEKSKADESIKQDVYLELAAANNGLKRSDEAVRYWTLASTSLTKTGARATCMLGDHYFRLKEFDPAVTEFKKVFFGFGGDQADKSIRPWQAYARYEAARCSYVQVASIKEISAKQKLVQVAVGHFKSLIEDYPDDKLVPEAKRQIETLKAIKFK